VKAFSTTMNASIFHATTRQKKKNLIACFATARFTHQMSVAANLSVMQEGLKIA